MNTYLRRARRTILAVAMALGMSLGAGAAGAADRPVSDDYIAGYAAALLEREFQVAQASVRVKNGVVTVYSPGLGPSQEQVRTALQSIKGVQRVDVADASELAVAEPGGAKTVAEPEAPTILPKSRLFWPLVADPRWPHFSASYQRYLDNPQLGNVGSTSFGETFSLYRNNAPFDGKWDVGIQAAVFAIFDLDAPSKDLINADYWVGIPLTYRSGDFSGLFRVFHQSSHLGDEYILRGRAGERLNLSYESVETILSYDLGVLEKAGAGTLGRSFRLYGGGGYLFDQDPSDVKPWTAQYGLEFRSPWTWWNGKVKPIAAVDVQHREESDWNADLSLRAGVEFQNPDTTSPRLQLLLEYYDGYSPNGQFFNRVIQYLGLGIHLHYY
jgi:hypothetical protein